MLPEPVAATTIPRAPLSTAARSRPPSVETTAVMMLDGLGGRSRHGWQGPRARPPLIELDAAVDDAPDRAAIGRLERVDRARVGLARIPSREDEPGHRDEHASIARLRRCRHRDRVAQVPRAVPGGVGRVPHRADHDDRLGRRDAGGPTRTAVSSSTSVPWTTTTPSMSGRAESDRDEPADLEELGEAQMRRRHEAPVDRLDVGDRVEPPMRARISAPRRRGTAAPLAASGSIAIVPPVKTIATRGRSAILVLVVLGRRRARPGPGRPGSRAIWIGPAGPVSMYRRRTGRLSVDEVVVTVIGSTGSMFTGRAEPVTAGWAKRTDRTPTPPTMSAEMTMTDDEPIASASGPTMMIGTNDARLTSMFSTPNTRPRTSDGSSSWSEVCAGTATKA